MDDDRHAPELQARDRDQHGRADRTLRLSGPAYDGKLKEVDTTLSGKDVMQPRGYLAVLFQDTLADNSPLRVARYVDQAMLDAIAAEDGKGPASACKTSPAL